MPDQFDLFPPAPSLPQGFKYQPEFLSPADEQALVRRLAELPFKEFEFQGYRGKRRVISFGWQYDFNRMELQRTEAIPESLLPCVSKLRSSPTWPLPIFSKSFSQSTLLEPASAGTRTNRCLARRWASRSLLHVGSA